MYSDEQAAAEGFAGAFGGGVTTAVTTGVSATWDMVDAEQKARTSPQQVALISTLAEQAPVEERDPRFPEDKDGHTS